MLLLLLLLLLQLGLRRAAPFVIRIVSDRRFKTPENTQFCPLRFDP